MAAAGQELSFGVDNMLHLLLKPKGLLFNKTIPLRDGASSAFQSVMLSFESWAKFCAILPELKQMASEAKAEIDKWNETTGGEGSLPSHTWRLSNDFAVFLSAREGSGQFQGKYFLSMCIRGCFEKDKKIYPRKGQDMGVNLSLEGLNPLQAAMSRVFSKCYQEFNFHGHDSKLEPLCEMCSVLKNGPVTFEDFVLRPNEEVSMLMLHQRIMPALRRLQEKDWFGTLYLSISGKGMRQPGLPVRQSNSASLRSAPPNSLSTAPPRSATPNPPSLASGGVESSNKVKNPSVSRPPAAALQRQASVLPFCVRTNSNNGQQRREPSSSVSFDKEASQLNKVVRFCEDDADVKVGKYGDCAIDWDDSDDSDDSDNDVVIIPATPPKKKLCADDAAAAAVRCQADVRPQKAFIREYLKAEEEIEKEKQKRAEYLKEIEKENAEYLKQKERFLEREKQKKMEYLRALNLKALELKAINRKALEGHSSSGRHDGAAAASLAETTTTTAEEMMSAAAPEGGDNDNNVKEITLPPQQSIFSA